MSNEKENQSPSLKTKESVRRAFNDFFASVSEIGSRIDEAQAKLNADEEVFQEVLKKLEIERQNTSFNNSKRP